MEEEKAVEAPDETWGDRGDEGVGGWVEGEVGLGQVLVIVGDAGGREVGGEEGRRDGGGLKEEKGGGVW
ncbi:hypothetical protein B1218_35350 [Pseudomonas ogarae]|nr:hypothetical protein B1218_35350 [Pseudomonas ogarae]